MGGVAGIGVALGVIGTLQQGQAAYAAGKFNSDVARQNARISLEQAKVDAASQSRESRRIIGSIRSGYGASGVTSEGSVSDVIEFSEATAELDRQNILYRGKIRAMGYEAEARISRAQGRQGRLQSVFQSASQLLTYAGTPSNKAET